MVKHDSGQTAQLRMIKICCGKITNAVVFEGQSSRSQWTCITPCEDCLLFDNRTSKRVHG